MFGNVRFSFRYNAGKRCYSENMNKKGGTLKMLFAPRRLTLTLDESLGQALAEMAHADLRPPKKQLQWLIQQEAQRRGLAKNEGSGGRLDNEPATLGSNA